MQVDLFETKLENQHLEREISLVIESHYSRGGQALIIGVKIQGSKFFFFLGCGF